MKEIGTRPTLLPRLRRVEENHEAKESGSRGESQGADLNLDDHIG